MLVCMLVFSDLEGPLSPQDFAYEAMRLLIPGGPGIFEALSAYDDYLAGKKKIKGYASGDTLSLLSPFLVAHGITNKQLFSISKQLATLTPGAREFVPCFKDFFVISTAYCQHTRNVASMLGVPRERVRSTMLDLDRYNGIFADFDFSFVLEAEKKMFAEEDVNRYLDSFFWGFLAGSELGILLKEVKSCGGFRKADCVRELAGENRFAVMGDSIVDREMFDLAKARGCLAIAFNANRWALEAANAAVASESLLDCLPLLRAFEESGLEGAKKFVLEQKATGGKKYDWMDNASFDEVVSVHGKMRERVRGKAAGLS